MNSNETFDENVEHELWSFKRDSKGILRQDVLQLTTNTPPSDDRTPQSDQWYSLYLKYKDNIFPTNDAWLQLPNYYIEVMRIIRWYDHLDG